MLDILSRLFFLDFTVGEFLSSDAFIPSLKMRQGVPQKPHAAVDQFPGVDLNPSEIK